MKLFYKTFHIIFIDVHVRKVKIHSYIVYRTKDLKIYIDKNTVYELRT